MKDTIISDTPTSIKIVKGVLILLIAILAIRLATSLEQLPKVLGTDLPAMVLVRIALRLAMEIALIVFTIFVLRWMKQRLARGRWGAVTILALCMGNLGSSSPALVTNPTQEQIAFQGGALAGILIPWAAFLFLGLRLVFGKAVKAYFLNPKAPEQNSASA